MLGQLLLVALSASLTLAFLEMGLRLFAPQYGNYVQPDDVIGYSFVPGAYYVSSPWEHCPGWGSSGKINSHGLRDREYDYAKPPGTFRILALGDSQTEGFQFELEKIWSKLLERRLNERGSELKYEVINAGRSAMGTGTEYLYYLNKGRNYDPDLVLVLFVPNDFKDNSRELNSRPQAYYFFLSEGKLLLDSTFTDTWSYRVRKLVHPLKQLSYVVSFTTQLYNQIEARLQVASRASGGDLPWLTRNEETAVAVTQQLFRELSKAAIQDGARLAIAIGTADVDKWTDTSKWAQQKRSLLVFRADQIMTDFAALEGLPYVNLEPILRGYSRTHRVLIHGCVENGGRGHWSEPAHRVAADAIYDFLVDQALVP